MDDNEDGCRQVRGKPAENRAKGLERPRRSADDDNIAGHDEVGGDRRSALAPLRPELAGTRRQCAAPLPVDRLLLSDLSLGLEPVAEGIAITVIARQVQEIGPFGYALVERWL